MYKEVLNSIGNVEIWPIIGLVIFFLFFLMIIIRVIFLDKKYIEKIEKQPLEDGTLPADKKIN